LRPQPGSIIALEDRYADFLAHLVTDAPVVVARHPRACIDLNRHEFELDPGMVDGAVASRLILSPKVRSGLGVVPRRLAGVGELWSGRLSLAEVEQRIATIHRPYHQMLSDLLRRARAHNGIAVLVDLHSMPGLPRPDDSVPAPAIVIGNRFGQSASGWVGACAAALCDRFGLSWRENSPYAGGFVVERHGAPARGVHALQIEIDRSLYLDANLDRPEPARLGRMQEFVAALVSELGSAALDETLPLAAE
jgi:N-formylglutamate amidohydrolase